MAEPGGGGNRHRLGLAARRAVPGQCLRARAPSREAEFVADGSVNLAAFWAHMDKPAAHSADGEIWALGEGANERAESLRSLQAPDFTLPDLDGKPHSLSDYKGKKVLLATWASW